jgi:hypothetical protein
MKRTLLGMLLAIALVGATAAPIVVTTQILDYEKGYVFFTTGDGFRVAPNVQIVNGPAATRRFARVTFDESGVVTKIEVSNTKLPPEGDLSAVHRFAIALSPAAPNPDLAPPTGFNRCKNTIGGRLVTVTVSVQVPPSTGLTEQVYMTSDQSGWYAQAYRLDRVDALHYQTLLKLYSGTQLHVLFDRGSTQSIQVGQNGIEQPPLLLCVGNEDVQAFSAKIYHWADEQIGGQQQLPQTLPTPYNPAPFPNLPVPPAGVPTPHA